MLNIQSGFGGNSPQSEVQHSTEPLLSILIDRIGNIPFEGYFMAYDVPDLPTDTDDCWRIKYSHISGDDYLITAVRVWGDDIYTRRMNTFSKTWKSEKWEELINSGSLARKAVGMTYEVCPDLDTFIEVNKYSAVTPDTQNLPTFITIDFGRVINIGTDSTTFLQILYARNNAILYRGYAAWETPKFHQWRRLIDDTLSLEHDLPLVDGVTAIRRTRFTKEQNNREKLRICVTFPPAETRTAVVGTLPVGYRSVDLETNSAMITEAAGDVMGPGTIEVLANGIVRVYANRAGFIGAVGSIEFPTYYDPTVKSSQVRVSTDAMPIAEDAEASMDRCMCVVDRENRYVEFVLVTISSDDTGMLYTVNNYTLGDGEHLVDTPVPPIKYLQDPDNLTRPIWDEATSTWLETEG